MSTRTGAVHSPTLDTIRTIIEYLLELNKIAIDARDRVCWIYDPELARYYLEREDLRIG